MPPIRVPSSRLCLRAPQPRYEPRRSTHEQWPQTRNGRSEAWPKGLPALPFGMHSPVLVDRRGMHMLPAGFGISRRLSIVGFRCSCERASSPPGSRCHHQCRPPRGRRALGGLGGRRAMALARLGMPSCKTDRATREGVRPRARLRAGPSRDKIVSTWEVFSRAPNLKW